MTERQNERFSKGADGASRPPLFHGRQRRAFFTAHWLPEVSLLKVGCICMMFGAECFFRGNKSACIVKMSERLPHRDSLAERGRRSSLSVIWVIAAVALDQAVKYWTVHTVRAAGSIPGIPGLFRFVYVENRGAAFGSFEGMRALLIAVTCAAVGGIVWAMKKGLISGRLGRLSACMILAGAIGNLIDRIRLGYVVDMIDLTFMKFAVFNVADCFVCVGTALFAWYVMKTPGALGLGVVKSDDSPACGGRAPTLPSDGGEAEKKPADEAAES